MRPRIVIPTNYRDADPPQSAQACLNDEYVRLVWDAGGLPVLAPPLATEEFDALARAYWPQGVLLTGGTDLDAGLYGQATHPKARPLPPLRQAAELAWAKWADEAGVPLLGICLGCQVINVARGGSLVQYLPGVPGATDHADPAGGNWHDVRICAPHLRRTVGADTIRVNSHHRQAVDSPGRGLDVAARATDGVVEAVQDATGRFVLGLQWHPERFRDAASTQSIMAAFLAAAGGAR